MTVLMVLQTESRSKTRRSVEVRQELAGLLGIFRRQRFLDEVEESRPTPVRGTWKQLQRFHQKQPGLFSSGWTRSWWSEVTPAESRGDGHGDSTD